MKKSTADGIPVQGEKRRQIFSQEFVAEALILSDLFDLNELAAVELLMAGQIECFIFSVQIIFPVVLS